MGCDRCGKRLKSNHIVNVQRHYESDSCQRKTAEMNLQKKQQSQPPAEKRQRLLCTSATNAVACNESVAVACEESVAEPNHRFPKPFCRGYLPDLPSPFVQNWAFAAHGLQQQQLPFTFEQSGLRALDCERFAPYGYASCDPCTRLKYNIKVLAMFSRARETGLSVTHTSNAYLKFAQYYVFIVTWFL